MFKLNSKLIVLFVLTVSLGVFSSCSKEEETEDITKDVTYTYTGVMNSGDVQTTDFDVVVSKVDNTTVKITPETGSAFEVGIALGANGTVNGDAAQVVFINNNGVMGLTYNNDDGQFVGTKQ